MSDFVAEAQQIVDAFHAKHGKDKRLAITPHGTLEVVQATPQEMAEYEACRAAVENNERLRAVAAAAREFFSLPNWENRIGPFADVQQGLARLAAAMRLAGYLHREAS